MGLRGLLYCWELFFSFFGVAWVFPYSIRQALEGWKKSFVGKKWKDIWRAGPLCLFWTVWNARNNVAFEDEELSIQKLKSSFV